MSQLKFELGLLIPFSVPLGTHISVLDAKIVLFFMESAISFLWMRSLLSTAFFCRNFLIVDWFPLAFEFIVFLLLVYFPTVLAREPNLFYYITDSIEDEKGIHAFIIFTNPSARAGYDTRSIFKRSLTCLNSEYSFS